MWRRRRKNTREEELEEEIQAHLAIEARQRMEAGQTPEEAERDGRRAFGNVGLVKEVTREMWGQNRLESLVQDLRYGLRTLRKAPAFAATAVLTIGLGVGASTAVFSVVSGVLLRALPYPDADRVAMLWRLAPVGAVSARTSTLGAGWISACFRIGNGPSRH